MKLKLEHFQQKCEAVLRRIMRKNKEIDRFLDSAGIRPDLERFRFSLNRMRFPNQFCSDSLMLAGWRPALDDRTDIE
ncbi:hypothetical protein BLA27_26700 [Brucella cytisi]|uniref:Uncharacterized protein n=1 Tax=Brucella cytisi TaxID=407152 RepID=A0A1J6HQH3_9HYPH|nr:hypothetical protein BLA27_26700 [Brucella cytisi]